MEPPSKEGADPIKAMPSGGVLDERRSGDDPQLTVVEIEAVVAAAHDDGVIVATYTHGDNAHEFALMLPAGMRPLFAIQAATTHAAELLRHPGNLGVIAPGAYADVIAVPGDPLADVARLQDVTFVMKGGEVYKLDGRPVE